MKGFLGGVPGTQVARYVLMAIGCLTILVSLSTGAQASWLYGKATLAQYLLNQAWQYSLLTKTPQKPWSWADVSSVARLNIPSLNESFIVLSDASGEAMAFGPGLVGGDLLTSKANTIAIGGHRDTHLQFLEQLRVGASLSLENTAGEIHSYQLVDKQIVDTRTHSLQIARQSPGLVLITCYPFNARQTGGPLRLVARAIHLDTQRI